MLLTRHKDTGHRFAGNTVRFVLMGMLMAILFCLDLGVGGVYIPFGHVWGALTGGDCPESEAVIVTHIRLVKGIVAICVGASLTVSGLQMQTLFRNPLAGPYVLGISSGASFGVAVFIMGLPFLSVPDGLLQFGVAGAAWAGAVIVLAVIAAIGNRIKDIMVILILGMMFSSGVSAIVQILQYMSQDEALKSYVIWTMGSLGDVTYSQLYVLIPSVVAGLVFAIFSIKPLNLLLLGEEYARTMGLDIRKARGILFLSTSLLAGSATAFCGPIGFIGLAMPHVTRMIMRNADHRILIPATILSGACVMLVCDIVSKLFTLPINAITALVGIPVIVAVVIRNSR